MIIITELKTLAEFLKQGRIAQLSNKVNVGVILAKKDGDEPDFIFGYLKLDFSIEFTNEPKLKVLSQINKAYPIVSIDYHTSFDVAGE